jgi:hypothetical protein
MPDDVVTGLDLHQHISGLLTGALSFAEFDDWLAGSTWEDSDVAPDALRLVRSVQLVLAEFSSGHRTCANVWSYLADVAMCVQIQVFWGDAPIVTTGSTAINRTLTFPARLAGSPGSGMNIRLEVVCA